jgi:alpha-galactosidase
MSPSLPEHGPTGGVPISGHQLATMGLWMPRRPPETAQLITLTRQDDQD